MIFPGDIRSGLRINHLAGNVFNQRSKGRVAETVTEKIEILIVPFLKVYSNSKSLQ